MCGIAGYYGSFDPKSLNNFVDVLRHRGPDDYGVWSDGDVGLAHTRLSIIDLSDFGHQPMQHDNLVITYNGEIYNYQELKKELIGKGEHFVSESDTEVVLKMYKYYGAEFVERLNGIFAFAIWETDYKTLFVARDHFGVKPFYYSFTDLGFVFASELKALFGFNIIDKTIDPKSVANYVTYLWSPGESTMITAVKKLEPGNAMIIKNRKLEKKWQFYDLPYRRLKNSISEEQAIKEVRCLVQQAVKRQMVADVPVGAFLSGGLDSSAIVASAKIVNPETKLQCFTIDLQCKNSSQDGFVDDLPYAEKVAKFLKVDLNVVTVGSDIIKYLEKMIYHLDEPQGDPAPLNVLLISQMAKENGMKVLLSGAGGDDIFAGYRRHYALTKECYWQWLPKSCKVGLQQLVRFLPQRSYFLRKLVKAFKYMGLEADSRIVSYFYWLDPKWLNKILSHDILAKLENFSPADPMLTTLEHLNSEITPLSKMLYLESKHFLADHNLNYTDKMGMAEGVEIRVPLLDLDLVNFVVGLPDHYKQRGSTGKWIFKKAMEGILPHEIIYRPKTGFGAPLRRWLRHELKEMVDDLLSVTKLNQRGMFNPAGVRELITQDRKGIIDAAYPIFAILCVELWCQIFLDRPKAGS